MLRKLLPVMLVAIVTMLLTIVFQPLLLVKSFARSQVWQAADTQTCQTFSETGFEVCGRFLAYWYKYGGLPVFGYPVGIPLKETSPTDGKEYLVQYFERAEFELHPENQPPYDVLLSQLGREKYEQLYPNGTSGIGIGVVGDPQPEMNLSKEVMPGIFVTLIRAEQSAITGLYTGNCGLEMTWVLQVENRSSEAFVAAPDTNNLGMLDSTGKNYPPTRECGGTATAPYSGSFGQAMSIKPGDTLRGTIEFQVSDIPLSASYFELHVNISGAPVEFRYILP
jgi:hypothetical protein